MGYLVSLFLDSVWRWWRAKLRRLHRPPCTQFQTPWSSPPTAPVSIGCRYATYPTRSSRFATGAPHQLLPREANPGPAQRRPALAEGHHPRCKFTTAPTSKLLPLAATGPLLTKRAHGLDAIQLQTVSTLLAVHFRRHMEEPHQRYHFCCGRGLVLLGREH